MSHSQISRSFVRMLFQKCLYQLGIYVFLYYSWKSLSYLVQFGRNCSFQTMKIYIFQLRLTIPYFKRKLEGKKQQIIQSIRKELNQPICENELFLYTTLSMKSDSTKWIQEQIQSSLKLGTFQWKDGKVSGTIYTNPHSELQQLMTSVFPYYYLSNPLHPDIFPGVRKMEAEIIQMVANLFHSPDPSAGSFTTGGTESILLACRAYRELAKQKGIDRPSIIICHSAHAAYWKAADYFGIELIEISFDRQIDMYGQLPIAQLESVIQSNTVAVIASAPTFHFGIVDDIQSIAEFCYHRYLYLHVDMCLGGFLLPFLEDYHHISFQLPGITSISVDTHKYGCGPKGI